MKCSNTNCKSVNPTFYILSSGKQQNRCKDCYKDYYKRKTGKHIIRSRKVNNYRIWTTNEEKELIKLYPHNTTKILSDIFNRPIESIRVKARELNLRKIGAIYYFDIDNLPSCPGVYIIQNTDNKKCYVGSSLNIKARCQEHYNKLSQQKHINTSLQKDWNRYQFKYGYIELCEDIYQALKIEYCILRGENNLYNTNKAENMPNMKIVNPKRLEKHIQKGLTDDDCWLWKGYLNEGYGRFTVNGVTYSAHKAVYIYYNGQYEPWLKLRHMCKNKNCCNPDHLKLGSDADNSLDYHAEKSQLTHEDVYNIRQLWLSDGVTLSQVKQIYTLANRNIVSNKSKLFYDPNYIPPKKKTNGKIIRDGQLGDRPST